MSKNLNKKEAPLAMPAEGKVEFSFRASELVNIKQACQALRDFRHCGIDNMRKFHANNKLLATALEEVSDEEEVLRDLHTIIYGPEASKLSPEELAARTKEFKKANKEYGVREYSIHLYTVPNSVFEPHLADESKFPKKTINNTEIDTLVAYLDLCSEGIIT